MFNAVVVVGSSVVVVVVVEVVSKSGGGVVFVDLRSSQDHTGREVVVLGVSVTSGGGCFVGRVTA